MITVIKKLIGGDEIKKKLPLGARAKLIRQKKQDEIKRILSKEDQRLLLIIGPCSADNEDAFYRYLELLKGLEQKVKDKLLIVPRLYTAKPRSKGDSYKGIIFSKDPKSMPVDFDEGLLVARRMFITALSDFEFACADELLHLDTLDYFDDVASYAVIGARNAESQQHRFLASGLDIPVAFKNPLNGDLSSLRNAIYTASLANTFMHNGCQVSSSGNDFVHAILRGGVDRFGNHFSNYGEQDMLKLMTYLNGISVKNPAIIIDVNHSNSAKNYQSQGEIMLNSFRNIKNNAQLSEVFRGYMLESYIEDGACAIGEYEFGKSVTDGCLGFEKTGELVLKLFELMS